MLLQTGMETAGAWSWWMSVVDTLEVVAAAVVVALVGWCVALWKWKPQLSLEQFVSWRWSNDDTFSITVIVRYSNTSRFRNISVIQVAVALKRMAQLSPVEAAGDEFPDLLPKRIHSRQRDKSSAPVLDPGESATDMFNFLVPEKTVVDLRAFMVHTAIPETKNSERGWVTITCHDIKQDCDVHRKRCVMTDEQNEMPAETPSAEPAPPPAETPSAEPAPPPAETPSAEPAPPPAEIREWKQIQSADTQPIEPSIGFERPEKPKEK